MTKFPELFASLAAEFPQEEVKRRQGVRGTQLAYITARTAMNRLDSVLGPENWWDEYEVARDNSTLCRLTVRLPDGSTVTKQGLGVTASAVGEDAEKGGESDALKRAAAKFGVARYLYRDGVPDYAPARTPSRTSSPIPVMARRPGSSEGERIPTLPWNRLLDRALARWALIDPFELIESKSPPDLKSKEQVAREHRLVNALITAAIEDEKLDGESAMKSGSDGGKPSRDTAKVWYLARNLYRDHPDWVKAAIKLYLDEKQATAEAMAKLPRAS